VKAKFLKPIVLAAAVVAFLSATIQVASAQDSTTTAAALASIGYLTGTWHCTGGGPAEDDTYTISGNWWRDTDSTGGLTVGTFDAKRQKWVIFSMGQDGGYAVIEGAPPAANANQLATTIVYPAGAPTATTPIMFTKISDTQYTLGKQTCTKK
jgi:hypothetical protein